jgi:hypothetical protein
MKRWMAVLATVLALANAGCGGDDNTGPSSTTGQLVFKSDESTCGAGNAELFVDGSSMGIYAFDPGDIVPFTVSAGSHTAGAREVGGSQLQFPTQNVSVPASSSYTYVMVCP